MAHHTTHLLQLQYIPDVRVVVVVARKHEAPALTEGQGRYPADDRLVTVASQLLVTPDVEYATGCVVRAGSEYLSGGHEGDGIDVELVSLEGLVGHAVPDVPQLGGRVTGSWRWYGYWLIAY